MKPSITPHITEKSYAGISEEKGVASTYTFKIRPDLSKDQVKSIIEREFKVTVTDIRTVSIPGKTRRFKGVKGRTSDKKKAIVRLAPGQKIAAFDLPDQKEGDKE